MSVCTAHGILIHYCSYTALWVAVPLVEYWPGNQETWLLFLALPLTLCKSLPLPPDVYLNCKQFGALGGHPICAQIWFEFGKQFLPKRKRKKIGGKFLTFSKWTLWHFVPHQCFKHCSWPEWIFFPPFHQGKLEKNPFWFQMNLIPPLVWSLNWKNQLFTPHSQFHPC